MMDCHDTDHGRGMDWPLSGTKNCSEAGGGGGGGTQLTVCCSGGGSGDSPLLVGGVMSGGFIKGTRNATIK